MSELDWMHDDITWCARECPDHECERNRVNRRQKKGMFSTGDMYKEGKCPPEASIEEFNKRIKEYKEKPSTEKEIVRKLFDRIAKSQADADEDTAFGDYDENAQVKGGMTYGNLRDLE